MSPVYVWRYTLRSASGLNARSARREHAGALVCVDGGFGNIHPWPELGDLTIEEQLQMLARGQSTPLIAGALRCAKEDGLARAEGRSLFVGPIPESHWLNLPGDEPEEAKTACFSRVKMKIGRDLPNEIERAKAWGGAGFALRFDGNESLTSSTLLEFWKALGNLRDQVDFFEDPIPWEPYAWQKLRDAGIPLAVDREAETRFHTSDMAVIKPALSQWIPPAPAPFFVSSYMDHALGQMWAAAEVSRLAAGPDGDRMRAGGLLTHRCFEPDPFFEQIRSEGPHLLPPTTGRGLGFDDLLEGLPWKRLT